MTEEKDLSNLPIFARSSSEELLIRADFVDEYKSYVKPGATMRVIRHPVRDNEGPCWVEQMDKYIGEDSYIEIVQHGSYMQASDVGDRGDYFAPRVTIDGFVFSMDWVETPGWTKFINKITGAKFEDLPLKVADDFPASETESPGLGMLFGALALAASAAVIKSSTEKKLVSKANKEKSHQVKETQGFIK